MSIHLEPWAEDDLPLLQALLGDPAMMEHLGGPEAPEKIVERHAPLPRHPGALKIMVDGVAAGWVGFWEHEWQGEPIYEIGWSVLPGFQGRGVASAGTLLALEAARASDGPRSVHAFPPPENGASNAVCRKCGFTLLGEVQFEYPKGHWGAEQRLGHRPRPLTITGAAAAAGPRCARRPTTGLMRRVPIVGAMPIDEARLEDVGSGLAPVTPGWFVVNAGEAAWVRNEAFGGRCVFESSPRVLAERPDAEPQFFTETGFTLAVLEPGKPSGMYHAESSAGGLPRPRRHLPAGDRGSGATTAGVGFVHPPARHPPHVRRHRRRAPARSS